ncbi:MAG: nuclear transport factor 2 family protein [Pseudomonadales bacterium]
MDGIETRLAALEAEVQHLRDCEAIRQLLASYGPLADTADSPEGRSAIGALFSENGVYDLGDEWQATGPNAIGELLNNPDHLALVANGSAHVMGLPFITVKGDTATALSYSRVYRHSDGEFSVWRLSANRWECAREDGQWRVTRRVNRLLDGNDQAKALLRGE